jgi:hypothetical protein
VNDPACLSPTLSLLFPTNREMNALMSKQALGNAAASLLFLAIAIVDFINDSSGIGAVFLVFAAVYLGLALSGKNRK